MHAPSEHPPAVSVILPASNAEKYVAEAVESILSQTYTDFELIVIDDGSTDRTFGEKMMVTGTNLFLLRNFVRMIGINGFAQNLIRMSGCYALCIPLSR